MVNTREIQGKIHVFVIFRCFGHNRKSGGRWQMYLPCIIRYFGCIGDLDDVLTSNTSKYIQYIGYCKFEMYLQIWDVLADELDVLYVYAVCIVWVFRVYYEFMSNPYQSVLPVAAWQVPFALPPSKYQALWTPDQFFVIYLSWVNRPMFDMSPYSLSWCLHEGICASSQTNR